MGLEGFDDHHLVLRGNTGEHPQAVDLGIEFLLGHLREVCAGDALVVAVGDAQFFGDGKGGVLVVAGDHNGADRSFLKVSDSAFGLGARGVDHADQAHEGEVFLLSSHVVLADGQSQHTQSQSSHLGGAGRDLVQILLGDGTGHTVLQDVGTVGKEHVGGAFGIADHPARRLFMDSGHHLPARIKGLLRHTGLGGFHLLPGHAEGHAHIQESDLGGVTDLGTAGNGGVIAEDKAFEESFIGLGVQILHVFGLAVDVYMGDGHAVLGQGTGFIGADHADSAQGLYSGQAADNGVDLDHPLDTQGQNDGHNSRQALGDGGYRQGDCGEQHLHDITLLPYGDAEQRHTDEDSQAAQKLAQVGKTLLQGGHLIFGFADHLGDLADLGVLSSGDNHAFTTAVGHAGGGVSHVDPVADANFFVSHIIGVFFNRYRFAGEGGFLNLQVDRAGQPQVGGDNAAGIQHNHVAHYQILGGDFHHIAAPFDQGVGAGELFQGFQGLFRFRFLEHADESVEQHHHQDDAGVAHLFEEDGNGCRCKQDIDHGVVELGEEDLELGFALLLLQLIGAVFLKALGSLLRGQALGQVGAELFLRLLYALLIHHTHASFSCLIVCLGSNGVKKQDSKAFQKRSKSLVT